MAQIVDFVAGNEYSDTEVKAIFEGCLSALKHARDDAHAGAAASTFELKGHEVWALEWLKEGFSIIAEDQQMIQRLGPMTSELLQLKMRENGGSLSYVSGVAALMMTHRFLLPVQSAKLDFTIALMNISASFPTPAKLPILTECMQSIAGLVNILWNTMATCDIISSLNALYAIISNTDGRSKVCPGVAHILAQVPPQVVEGLVPQLLNDPATSNESLTAMLFRLTQWIPSWLHEHEQLLCWLRTMLRALYQARRITVPAKVTMERLPQLFQYFSLPVLRPLAMSVMSMLMLSYQHSTLVFHKYISSIVDSIKLMETKKSTETSATKVLDKLVEMSYTLLAMHPGYDVHYSPLMDVLQKFPRPSTRVIRMLIEEHAWGDRHWTWESSPSHDIPRPPQHRVGLRNLGNTCYLNATLQALFMTDRFRHGILTSPCHAKQSLLFQLQRIFALLCFSHRPAIAPRTFHDDSRPPWFSSGVQQDCSEYLRHLLITLHEEERAGQTLPDFQEREVVESEAASLTSEGGEVGRMEIEEEEVGGEKGGRGRCGHGEDYMEVDSCSDSGISGDLDEQTEVSSPEWVSAKECVGAQGGVKEDRFFRGLVQEVFGGICETTTRCLHCNTKSVHRDNFTEINLAFRDDQRCSATTVLRRQSERTGGGTACAAENGSNRPKTANITLDDLMLNYLTTEQLTGDNRYECERCRSKQEAERSIQIHSAPEHLIMTQLRFFYDTARRQRQKVFTNVTFGETFHMPLQFSGSGESVSVTDCSEVAASEAAPSEGIESEAEPIGDDAPISFPLVPVPPPSPCPSEDTPTDSLSDPPIDPTNILTPLLYDTYALYAVVVHSGFSSEGGHYYCFARSSSVAGLPEAQRNSHGIFGEWHNCNDDRVTPTTFAAVSELVTKFSRDTAYLLFYRRVGSDSHLSPDAPLTENLSALNLELREVVEEDLLQHRSEGQKLNRGTTKEDHSPPPPPPPGGCGPGGGGGFNTPSRVVF